MSKIYGLSNKIFERNEEPQSCASCLIRKVIELRAWLKTEENKKPDLSPTNTESVDLVKKSRKRKEANNDR